MKYTLLILGILLSVSQVFGQKKINNLNLDIKGNSVVNQFSDQEQLLNYLLINNKSTSNIYKLNAKMQVEDSIPHTKIDSKYKVNSGSLIENGQPVLFWSTKSKNAFISQKFDFKNHLYDTHEFEINLKKEKVLCQFTAANQLFIFTVLDDSNLIKAYRFTDSKTVRSQLINLNSLVFYDKDYKKQNLDQFLKYSFSLEKTGYESYELLQIDNASPTPLGLATNKKKFYIEDNTLMITFDHHMDYTEIIQIDLATYKVNQLHIKKPSIKVESRYEINSNSFLYQKNLVQVKTSESKLFLTIKNLEGGLIAEYSVNKREEIPFIAEKPTLQFNKRNGNTREIKKTSVLLNYLKNNSIAVTCSKNDEGFNITFGGIDPQNKDVELSSALNGNMIETLIYQIYYNWPSNPPMQKLQAFSQARGITATMLTDPNFTSIPGTIKPTVYQNINAHLLSKKSSYKSEIVFQFQQKMYLGYYDTTINQYNFFEFE
ncbi:hypothetical protein [Flavobacterium sp. NKUCC04_CG]|uniref:hypothetical protein n=1 Tax=Flavobacterium sp. NKUCC04_CG TaxID=2842121 RepID=UPI001C5AEFF2|nr:hypothetical protein [Flavobacterium sp. NKUCC04_CG]MBW3518352.1 hypothetical protein [Flavobacterium sp. NKUCC04_CG]